jgi:hypothetical protein
MRGLRKIAGAVVIVVLPLVGGFMLHQSASGMEVVIGASLYVFALGLIATWF